MFSVVLIEPEEAGNIGAVARVMKNFGVSELVIVNPKVVVDLPEVRSRAKHAQDVLKSVKVVKVWNDLDFDYLVATTAKLGTDFNLLRSPLSPKQLSSFGKENCKIGLVFGREGDGLTNEEIMKCDFTVTIPSSKIYPTLNLSHAVAVVLYELFQHHEDKTTDHIRPIGAVEKKQIIKLMNSIISRMDFQTSEKRETQRKFWKRLVGRAFLSKREAFVLMGFIRRVEFVLNGRSKLK